MTDRQVVLAEYFVTDERSLLFLMRRDSAAPEVALIDVSASEIREQARKWMAKINCPEPTEQPDEAAEEAFFRPFVTPLASMANPGDIIWFVPHRDIHGLPLHMLDFMGTPLIERNPVCYSPTASIVRYCRGSNSLRRERALVLGDSTDDLCHAREEARTVAEVFHTIPHLSTQATKELVERELGQRGCVDVFHIACHARFDRRFPTESGVVLSSEGTANGENLIVGDILAMDIPASLVTLSGCDTGVADRWTGDDLIGLASSFLVAGASSVLGSLWRVDDESTEILMERFYQGFIAGEPTAVALQGAQRYLRNMSLEDVRDFFEEKHLRLQRAGEAWRARAVRRSLREFARNHASRSSIAAGSRPFSNPYFWAPFIIIGDWR